MICEGDRRIDLGNLIKKDPEIGIAIQNELRRQQNHINLIASENHASLEVMEAQGSVLTDKYAEGYPGRRYYGGCEFIDVVEQVAIDRAKTLFKAEHANVQPHSGAQANMAAYFSILNPGDTVLGLGLNHGGHLTHGSPVNFSSKLYNFVPYSVHKESELIDYTEVYQLAVKHRPKLIVTGATAYPRIIDFQKFAEISSEVGSKLMVDMAHISGLIAAGEHPSCIPFADITTSTTHKTLRGPRGGLILSTSKLAKSVDKAVFPNTQGGPLEHIIAAKAVAFGEAMKPEFVNYQQSIKANAKALSDMLQKGGLRVVSGGTDTHMILVDVTSFNITGRQAEDALNKVHIVTNRNAIPYDPNPPSIASGLRMGTPSATTRGFGIEEINIIATLILKTLNNIENEIIENEIRDEVISLANRFPVPGIAKLS